MILDLILENTRNKYAMGLLEESAGLSEIDLLKGKIMINESTMTIRKMLVEEGTMESIKSFLEESWTNALLEEFSYDSDEGFDLNSGEQLKLYGMGANAAGTAIGAGADVAGAAYDAGRATGVISDMDVAKVAVPAAALVGAAGYGMMRSPDGMRRDMAAVRGVPGQVRQAAQAVRQAPADAQKGYTAGMNPNRFARNNPGFAYRAGQSVGGIVRPFKG